MRIFNLIIYSIVFLVILFSLSGCETKNMQTQNADTSKKSAITEIKIQNPYTVTKDYDGIYIFKEHTHDNSGRIYTTIGAFRFENGIVTVKYYLNDNYSNLRESNGVFGFDENGELKLKYENGTIWNISINNNQLSYNNRFSAYKSSKDDVILQYFGDNNVSFNQALENIKQEIASDELAFKENIRWLMSKEEIDNIVGTTSPIKSNSITYTSKNHSIYNNPYNIKETVYILEQKQLKAYFFNIDKSGYSYRNYCQIRDILVSKYGEPTIENFNWIDETYKNTPEKWDDAFRYSDFTIQTVWRNNTDFTIVMKWNYDGTCSIAYCQKNYENNL